MKTAFKAIVLGVLVLGIVALPLAAGATIYNLAADFSTTINPFDGWSLYAGSNLMNTYVPWGGDAPWTSAWSYNSAFSPIWFNHPYNPLDLLPGEVATYADNGPSRVVWTSDVTAS
jgi:hypothetical protein